MKTENVFNGDLEIKSRDTKKYSYTRITGSLTIQSDAKLDALTSVGGYLYLYDNAKLDAPVLTSVGGYLSLYADCKLDAPVLTSVGGNLSLNDNAKLDAPVLTSVGGYLYLNAGSKLDAPVLTSVGGNLSINADAKLDAPNAKYNVSDVPEAHARLKRVVILNSDAGKVICKQDGDKTVFYCDPPYLHETRKATDAYECEMSAVEHESLLQCLSRINGRFLLSGYPSRLYDHFAEAYKWRRVDIQIDNKASSAKTKEIKTECVWLNYSPGNSQ